MAELRTHPERPIIVIVGPTASGKSAVGFELAQKMNGEIVNADSRQIYQQLSAGTLKPGHQERTRVPHHLYDFLNPQERYSAGDYGRDAKAIVQNILSRRGTPIVVGGTGLYLRALFDGLAPLPPKNESLRADLLQRAQENGKKYLHSQLQKVDPASAEKIPYQNMQRVVRALEVYSLTQKPISCWHQESPVPLSLFNPLFFGLLWERSVLKERIFQRTQKILGGLIAETERLLKRGLTSRAPAMQSLGYASAIQFVQKKMSYEDLFNSVFRDTCHYSKRQMTWFKGDDRIRWIQLKEPFQEEKVAKQILNSLSFMI